MTGMVRMSGRVLGMISGLLLTASNAGAQTSLFAQPVAPAQEAESPDRPAAAKPKPKRAKPKGPTPARSLVISNASRNVLTDLEVSGGGKSARLDKPIAPDMKATLKLPSLKECTVTVVATFEGVGEADSSSYDICKEKGIRFTD